MVYLSVKAVFNFRFSVTFAAMHYASIENISKSFGIRTLFKNITLNIEEGDKIALVARNGSGKSTLLKIIAGKDFAEEGKIWVNKDVDVAFFEQEPQLEENKTVLDNIFHVAHPVINVIKEYEAALDNGNDVRITDLLSKM